MALDVATLPLILYRIEHVLHCENIIHIPTLFYYFAIPTQFFSFPMFFYLYIHETRGPKRHKFHYGQIKRSRHGPRCGHTPLDIVSYAWYITIEHVLHCENIIHIPTLFYYFAIPTPFFHFQCFFYLWIYKCMVYICKSS